MLTNKHYSFITKQIIKKPTTVWLHLFKGGFSQAPQLSFSYSSSKTFVGTLLCD